MTDIYSDNIYSLFRCKIVCIDFQQTVLLYAINTILYVYVYEEALLLITDYNK